MYADLRLRILNKFLLNLSRNLNEINVKKFESEIIFSSFVSFSATKIFDSIFYLSKAEWIC